MQLYFQQSIFVYHLTLFFFLNCYFIAIKVKVKGYFTHELRVNPFFEEIKLIRLLLF